MDVGIRFDELEEMKNIHNALLSAKEKNKLLVLVQNSVMCLNVNKRWTINRETDIELISNNIYKTIEKVAFPYIEKYLNMENAFKGCLNDGKESWLITGIDSKRAMNAVGLAKILNKTEQIDEIIQYKIKFLEEKNDFEFNLFTNFTNVIRESY